MNWADLAFILILVLSFIVGAFRGFWRSFAKVLVAIGAVVGGFALASKLGPAIFKGEVLDNINTFVYDKVVSMLPNFDGVILQGTDGLVVTVTGTSETMPIADALKMMFIPSFLQAPIIASALESMTIGAVVSSAMTHLIVLGLGSIIGFLILFILLSIISALIYKLLSKSKFNKVVDRVLGALLRGVSGFIFIIAALYTISLFAGVEFMRPVVEQIENGAICGPIYEANLFSNLLFGNGMSKLLDIFKDVIPVTPPPAETATILTSILL